VTLVIKDLAGQEGMRSAPDAAPLDPLGIKLRLDGVELGASQDGLMLRVSTPLEISPELPE